MTPHVSTFETAEPALLELLTHIHTGKAQLPDFQRGWVWDDNHIRSLIASVSRSFPIGAVMTMAVGENVRFRPRHFEGADEAKGKQPEVLVLDGQQRLTSMYLSLFSKGPVKTQTEKKQEIFRYYYLDIAKCLDPTEDRFDAVVSIPETKKLTSDFGRRIDLDLSTREHEYEQGMYPLPAIFDPAAHMEWTNGYKLHHQHEQTKTQLIDQFNMEIWLPFQQYKVPVIRLTKETPKEAVCQVFEAVNTGGVSLSVFELLTATFASDNFHLRDDWESKKKTLYDIPALKGVDESSYLTAITLLTSYQKQQSTNSAVSCKRKDVLNLSLSEYQENSILIIKGLKDAAQLLAKEKIFDIKTIPYQTQMIPLSAICAFLGQKLQNDTIKSKIMQWYWCGVLGELYGGANETRYALDITGVLSWLNGGEIPATIRDANFSPLRLLTLQSRLSAAYKGLMALLMKKGGCDFVNGDPVDIQTYFDQAIDIHHIFPKAYCEKQKYRRELWNSVINKAPLSSRTNRVIGGYKPSTYIESIQKQEKISPDRLDEIFLSHLIDPGKIRSDDFAGFIEHRAGELLTIIEQAMGKTISGRDSEEYLREIKRIQ
ncbi:protein of unknown function DUF262 [Methanospirillum hungatei JF-1]|uniref:GmrSD restriction endonucleases N-terminal domain-containing protein n=1 Tax=Methanospirillum hungatei JF-1 (strain ATCC 27890 / DSM 864 / NBRC 100397 / JF-1) TaxID=323259 RepID=Q2FRZ7_METHJ|nr:DUF262 domain-containing protein [Methanospirillum hungatei]ABD42650.1 protein of unknown function DUF262 [Methanospirillum hungatei JF-1]